MTEDERTFTRRELLRLGVVAGVALLWHPRGLLWGWEADPLPVTPNTMMGPFYPLVRLADQDTDLTVVRGKRGRAQGQVIHLVGRITTPGGEPIAGVQVEIWQANAFGRYDHPSDPNPAPWTRTSRGMAANGPIARGVSTSVPSNPHHTRSGRGASALRTSTSR